MKTKHSRGYLKKFLIASVFFHAILFLSVTWLPRIRSTLNPSPIEVVVLEIKPDSLQQESQIKHQVVETDENQANLLKDDKARFLSAKDNVVKKETVAQSADQFRNTLKKSTVQKTVAQQRKSDYKPHQSKSSKLFDTGFDVYSQLNAREDIKKMAAKETKATSQNPAEAASTNDKIKNVDQSLMTQLNTKEYIYYGYYQRIKNQLNQWWQPKVKEKVSRLLSKGRTIASTENKVTQVIIILNGAGSLVKVQVLGASGVRDLDDAAVEAFRQAAPFPNPPKGMIESDGTIKIRWDFVVES